MSVWRLSTGYVCALLALPAEADVGAARATSRSLPGGWTLIPPEAPTGSADVEVSLGKAAVTVAARTVHITLPATVAKADTLGYVSYTALERARQRRHKVTVHATALVSPDGRGVLLLGAKGTGKTSTALALAKRGWTHAGDDLVILGERGGSLTLWPGKPTAAVRDATRPLAPKPQRFLQPFATGPASMTWVVRLAVHPALTTTALTPAVPLSANERLRLHEMLGRYISGLPTPLNGVTDIPYGPVWPLDTPALAHWRHHLITQLTKSRFDYLHAPNPETAADLLAKEARRG